MRSLRRWLILTVAAAVLGGCHDSRDDAGGEAPPVATSSASPVSLPPGMRGLPVGAAVAYRDRDGIKVIVGGPQTLQFGFGTKDVAAPEFTGDGKHVFARAGNGGPPGNGPIVDFDVSTRQVRSIACDGAQVVPAGGAMLMWWEDPDRLMGLDLSAPDPKPKIMRTVQLPPAPDATAGEQSWQPNGTSVLGADRTTVIIGRLPANTLATGGPTYLFAVGEDGAARSIGQAESDGPVSRVHFSPDGRQVAYVGGHRVSSTSRSSIPVVIDTTTWQTHTSVIQEPADPAVVPGVGALWWDSDGALDAVYVSTRDDAPSPRNYVIPPNVWTLGEEGWNQIGFGGERWLYHLGHGMVLTLGPPADDASALTLIVDDRGLRTSIASGVSSVTARSSEGA